jgi:hypothetical protein
MEKESLHDVIMEMPFYRQNAHMTANLLSATAAPFFNESIIGRSTIRSHGKGLQTPLDPRQNGRRARFEAFAGDLLIHADIAA